MQLGRRELKPVRELDCSQRVLLEAAELVELLNEVERELEGSQIVEFLGTLGNLSANDHSHCRICTYPSEF